MPGGWGGLIRGLHLNIPNRTLHNTIHVPRQFVIIFIVVLPDLVNLEIAILFQVKLHLHIVLVSEVGELDRHGQIVPIEVFIADAFHHITHVEVHLAYDRKQ